MDAGVLAALKPLGVEPGKSYDPVAVNAIDGKALAEAARRIYDKARATWTNPDNPFLIVTNR